MVARRSVSSCPCRDKKISRIAQSKCFCGRRGYGYRPVPSGEASFIFLLREETDVHTSVRIVELRITVTTKTVKMGIMS